MEIYENTTTGKFVVSLGGEVWNNCTVDADCPGRALCAINVSWSEYPNMCSCLSSVGHTGATCSDVTPAGWFFFVLHILITVLAGTGTLLGFLGLYRMVKWGRFQPDALSSSLVYGILACFFTGFQTGVASRLVVRGISADKNGAKKFNTVIGPVAISLSFFFTTLAMLNVSLIWIQIAENASKLVRGQSRNILRYRNFLFVYYAIFLVTISAAVATSNFTLAAIASLPGIIFVIVTYMIGAGKMRKTLLAYLATESHVSGGATVVRSKESTVRVRASLRAIEHTAIGVSVSAANFVLWIGIWAIAGGFEEKPGRVINLVALTLAWCSVAMTNMIIMLYLHGTIVRKGQVINASNNEEPSKEKGSQPSNQPQAVAPHRSPTQDTSVDSPAGVGKRLPVPSPIATVRTSSTLTAISNPSSKPAEANRPDLEPDTATCKQVMPGILVDVAVPDTDN